MKIKRIKPFISKTEYEKVYNALFIVYVTSLRVLGGIHKGRPHRWKEGVSQKWTYAGGGGVVRDKCGRPQNV